MGFQHYESYGIDRIWVERLKKKAKEPYRKERLKELADGLTKEDLQSPDLVADLVSQSLKILGEKSTSRQKEQLVGYVLDQRIDPNNVLHLFKLWNLFR